MNIHWRFPKDWHFDLSIHRRQPVLGVNSKLADDMHFLMWDFDNVDYLKMRLELFRILLEYNLSDIYIMQSSKAGNYHAYCFTRVSWGGLVGLLLNTSQIDQQFVKLGVMRGYMTLRFTDKHDSTIIHNYTIPGTCEPDVGIDEIKNFERYWTVRHKHVR